jgi:hypothetical protein
MGADRDLLKAVSVLKPLAQPHALGKSLTQSVWLAIRPCAVKANMQDNVLFEVRRR